MSEYENPEGPPQAVEDTGDFLAGFGTIAIGVLALGAAYVLISGVPTTTRGATRSAQLQWEARQQQINAECGMSETRGGRSEMRRGGMNDESHSGLRAEERE